MNQNQSQSQSPLDETEVALFISRLVRAGETNTSIARQVTKGFGIETSIDSIRRFRHRHSLNIPGTEPSYTKIHSHGEIADCQTSVSRHVETDPDRMLKERGLAPDDWYIDSLTVNEWEGLQKGGVNKTKLYQTKFQAKRKRPYVGLMPVRSDGWQAPPKSDFIVGNDGELVVICGDQQAPFHDKGLHARFVEWLWANLPERGVILGDLGDFPDISRHPDDPENLATAQECLQASYDIMRDYVTASPDTKWSYLLGNHDERIRQYLLKNASRLYDLSVVDSEHESGSMVHSMSHLLRLDELGVELIDPHGTYENAQVKLSDNLAVRHGWVVRQGSGASALKTLEQTGYSIIVGHTHRQSCVYHTYHEMDGGVRQLLAVEAGCMCRVDGQVQEEKDRRYPAGNRRFPNYMTLPDWQQGFATANVYPDGKFKVDLATYVNGVLLYRDQRYV